MSQASNIGKETRLSRIFQGDGKSLIVAIGHAYIFGPIHGLENPEKLLMRLSEGR